MEKVIGESVQKTNQTFLRRYVDDYCKALNENYEEIVSVTVDGVEIPKKQTVE